MLDAYRAAAREAGQSRPLAGPSAPEAALSGGWVLGATFCPSHPNIRLPFQNPPICACHSLNVSCQQLPNTKEAGWAAGAGAWGRQGPPPPPTAYRKCAPCRTGETGLCSRPLLHRACAVSPFLSLYF